jgi:hypothetical protein
VGDRINKFDNLEEQTLAEFNKLFPECKLNTKLFDDDMEVRIGGPMANNRRAIMVGSLTLEHKMFSDILYTMDRDEYNNEMEKELDEVMGHPV